MFQKRLSSILSVLIVITLLLTAVPPTVMAQTDKVSPAGQFPIVKDPITLKILVRATSMIKDYSNNEFTKWVEKKTNIKMVFDVTPVAENEARQKLNLVLASGDLPDIIMNFPFALTLDQQQIMAEQGLIIPLDNLIEKYGFEFKNLMKAMPLTKDVSTLMDGKIYALPDINECYHCSLSQKMWIYKPWLDKLGLKMPETTDEFYAVLKAFKEKDPNGNGKADEVPLSGGSGWQSQIDSFLMNPFVYNQRLFGTRHLFMEKGTLKAAFTDPGWKEGLKYLNKLYAEKLLDPEAFTNDDSKQRALGESPNVPILGAISAGWYGVFTQNGGPSGRWKEYVPVPPLKGPTGLRQIPMNPFVAYTAGKFAITKNCKNPEAAFRLADLFYGFDATTMSIFGPEGEDWVRAKPDDVSIAGGKAAYTVLKIWSGEDHTRHWNQAAPAFRTSEYRLSQTFNPADPLERWLYEWTKNIYEPYGVKDKIIPPLLFTSAQSKKLSELNTVILSTVDQMTASFITGKMNVDKDWDSYIKTLQTNGIDEFMKINQDAYNAKYVKK